MIKVTKKRNVDIKYDILPPRGGKIEMVKCFRIKFQNFSVFGYLQKCWTF